MAYRTLDKPIKPEDALRKFAVRNGAIMRVTFGCYYSGHGHDPHYHDYINWPAPNYHPGPICQMPSPRDKVRWTDGHVPNQPIHLSPIHLIDEGYDEVAIAFDDSEIAEYLDANVTIDEETDNYIRMRVHANLPYFEDKPKETRFTVFAKKSDGSAIDAVCHGFVTVLPGSPYPTV